MSYNSEEIYKDRLRDQTTEYLTDLMYKYLDTVRLIREVIQERDKSDGREHEDHNWLK